LPDVHNLNDALHELESKALVTTAGAYVKLADVKKWAEEREAKAKIERVDAPQPKDMNQARRMVLKDEKIMSNFPPPTPRVGRSISAQDTQPSSRT
jgi:hypothetical protein